jgi:hypothetical protein
LNFRFRKLVLIIILICVFVYFGFDIEYTIAAFTPAFSSMALRKVNMCARSFVFPASEGEI